MGPISPEAAQAVVCRLSGGLGLARGWLYRALTMLQSRCMSAVGSKAHRQHFPSTKAPHTAESPFHGVCRLLHTVHGMIC